MIIPDFPWSNVFPMSFPFKVEIVHSKLRFSMFPPRFPPFQVEMLHDFPKFPQQNPPKKSVSSQQPAVFSCQASEPKINQLQMIRVLRSLKMMGIFWRKSHDGCHEFRATIHAWRKHAKNHDLYHGKTMRKTPRIPWNAMKHTMNKTEFIWNPQHTNWWWLCWIGGPLPHLGIVAFLGKMVKIINSSCQDATAKYKRLVEYSYFISIYPSIHPSIHSSIHPSIHPCLSLYLYLILYLYLSQCDAGASPNSQNLNIHILKCLRPHLRPQETSKNSGAIRLRFIEKILQLDVSVHLAIWQSGGCII